MKRFTGTEQGSLNDLADQLARSAGKCDLCNGRNWVFIVGTGRSGSTTMVNMLNAIPGFHIAGENYHVVHELMAVYGKAKRNRWPASGGPAQHRPVSELNVLCALQLITEELIGATSLATSRAVGFKDISMLKDELDFMLQLFPCARFIVNTRIDMEAQSRSGFWAENPNALADIKKKTAVLEQWQPHHTDRAIWFPLEKFSVAEFNHLLQWLNVTGCKFASVCHSNKEGTYDAGVRRPIMEGSCGA